MKIDFQEERRMVIDMEKIKIENINLSERLEKLV